MGWSPVRASTFGAMPSPVAPSSRGADVTKGVVSLLGLVALVVAVPFLLISFIGWPLPRGVPSFDEITAALGDRYVPDRFLVGALAVVCWLIWAELVASVVVEVIAQVRGRTAAQVPLRSEEHTSELQSLMRISYAVFCLKKKKNKPIT